MPKSERPLFYKNTSKNVLKIFRILKKEQSYTGDYLSVSEISRRTGLHRWTVSRTVDLWMSHFVDMLIPEELEQIGLKIKLIKLSNENVDEKAIIRSMSIRL